MGTKKVNYLITLAYRAVLTVGVKATDESEAKKLALEEFEKYRHFGNKIDIEDDCYNAHGAINMDETWNKIY